MPMNLRKVRQTTLAYIGSSLAHCFLILLLWLNWKTVVDEKYVASSSPVGGEKEGENAIRTSSSSSDSGSSSSGNE